MTPGWFAERTPDVPAIIMGSSGETVTYAQLEERSVRVARALRSLGLGVGDHIAILMENSRPYLEVAWAAQRSGLFYTAINTHLRAGEVQYILDDCGAVALVTSESMAEVVAGLDLSRVDIRVSAVGDLPGYARYDELLESTTADPLRDECEGREMLYSSGTTGRPKGVRKQLPGTPLGDPTSAPGADRAGPLRPRWRDRRGVPVAGTALSRGTSRLFDVDSPLGRDGCRDGALRSEPMPSADRAPRGDAGAVRPDDVRPDAAPSPRGAGTLRPLQPALRGPRRRPLPGRGEASDDRLVGSDHSRVLLGYRGHRQHLHLTEEWLAHPGSVGRPTSECHIVGDDGEELPPGEAGLVYFAGGRPFEYHNDPEKTASVTNERGWRTLGDVGYLDEDGYLYLTDRQAHMIISGGVNIYPQEAENLLAGHPAVADVAVIGVPDPEMGEAVKAVVTLTDPDAAGPELAAELLAFCRSELATYKCPRDVDFVDSSLVTTVASSTNACSVSATGKATTSRVI